MTPCLLQQTRRVSAVWEGMSPQVHQCLFARAYLLMCVCVFDCGKKTLSSRKLTLSLLLGGQSAEPLTHSLKFNCKSYSLESSGLTSFDKHFYKLYSFPFAVGYG